MSRLPLIQPSDSTGDLRTLFDAVQAKFGAVPNGVKAIGASPHTLRGYLDFAGALAGGLLSKAERERIAVLTAQRNECSYCLAAHTLAGRAAGLTPAQVVASRHGEDPDPRAAAVLGFAAAVLEHRGEVPDGALAAARAQGLTDGELIEIVAEVSLNTFTNYANRLIDPDNEFPPVAMTLERRSA